MEIEGFLECSMGVAWGSGFEISEDGEEADGGVVFGFHGFGDPGFVIVVFFLDGALVGFLLQAFVIAGGGEAFFDGFHEFEFELLMPGFEEGAEFGELAVEFRLGVAAEGVTGLGQVNGQALDGFREEFLDGDEVDGGRGVPPVKDCRHGCC